MKKIILLTAGLILLTIKGHAQTYTYDFEPNVQGWMADFADYPIEDSINFQLSWEHTLLPADIFPSQYGIFMSGLNYSDDLFFFIKKKISGLTPNTPYLATFFVDIVTNENIYQLGGSDLAVKAGADIIEPHKIIDNDDWYRMNLIKDPNDPETAMYQIGLARHSFNDILYHLFTLDNDTDKFSITSDSTGSLWVIIGGDGMFESYAKIYFAEVSVVFSSGSGIVAMPPKETIKIYPNPAIDKITIDCAEREDYKIKIYNIIGDCVLQDNLTGGINEIDISSLMKGLYIIQLTDNERTIRRKMIKE